MDILFFLILPIVTIIFAVVLQRILNSPFLVAATAFAIYLILAFTIFDTSFLINTIIYTILAFIAAYIAQIICPLLQCLSNLCPNMDAGFLSCSCNNNEDTNTTCLNSNNDNLLGNSSNQDFILDAELTPNANNVLNKNIYKRRCKRL